MERSESSATQGSLLAQQAGQKLCPEEMGQGHGVERRLARCSSVEEE